LYYKAYENSHFTISVLLVVVDTEDSDKSLTEIDVMCFTNEFTLLLAWSIPEAARYIETLKAYEKKAPSSIQEKVETEFVPKLTSVLTKANYINKTDVVTLLETFGSFKNICSATEQQLVLCPGIGEKKVARLHRALHAPFFTHRSSAYVAGSLPSAAQSEAGELYEAATAEEG
jgi:DNA excision repair protein ERCC-1